jgi:ABC-2 type transport system permease protein
MIAYLNHFTFEFKTGLRSQTQLLMNYLFPLGLYAMMGLVMTQVNPLFPKTIIPAMVVVSTMAATLLGLPGPLVESREAGIYRSFKINGVPAVAILAMPVLSTIFHVFIVTLIITVTAPAFFGGAAPTDWIGFVAVTVVTVFTCGAIGALIGVIAKDARSTVLWSQLIFLPSMLLGGLMMPLSMLPSSVARVAGILPPAHAMQAYLGLAFHQETVFDPMRSLAILATSGLLAFGLAIYLFNWDSRNNAHRGHPLMALLVLIPYVAGIIL